MKANSRYDSQRSSSVLPHFKCILFSATRLSLFLFLLVSPQGIKPSTIFRGVSLFCGLSRTSVFSSPPKVPWQHVFTLPRCTVEVAGGLAGIRRSMMGGSAAPGWSRFSLHSQSRTLAGYF